MSGNGGDVLEVFGAALDFESPADEAAYLDSACRGDAALRERVDALLQAHRQAGKFLQGTPPQCHRVSTEAPGTVIGPYKLVEQIGEGGFGVVYMAEQQQPLRRLVALKVVKPGMDSRQVIARFEAERQALALMQHPNIAQVLDAGETASGRPYFVMELVRGIPITDYCDQNRLSPNERLKLFAGVCKAVQHAHQKGVIHRDLKPSNLLVTLHDGTPVVKVIDFGIAKAIDQRLTDKTLVTGFAQVIGTPLYMSPEQAELSGLDIDTRSDIYSLGVLLYELLTGTTPFDKTRLRDASFDEMRRIIREEEPPRPSLRISTLGNAAATVSEQRRSDPKKLGQLLRGELDWIVMRCLEKDRTRRYETAFALARDVERYLADEPVEACPPSVGYTVRKFVRKHRRVLITAVAFLGILLVGGAVTAWQWVKLARTERDQAIQQTRRSQEVQVALIRATELRNQAKLAKADDSAKWAEARAMAKRAEALIESGPLLPDLARRVETLLAELGQEENDRRMVSALDEVRLRAAGLKGEKFDRKGRGPSYAAAFNQYSLSVEALPVAEAGRRVRESAIREDLLTAIHDWAIAVWKEKALREQLWAVADAADDDAWRREFRAVLVRKDWPRLRELSQDDQALRQPSSILVLFGQVMEEVGMTEEAAVWLRKAQLRHPSDFWVHTQLGLLLLDRIRPPHLDEAMGSFRVAVALSPESPGAWLNLGVAFLNKGSVPPAIACFQQALKLEPNYVMAQGWLGEARDSLGDLAGALVCFRRILELDSNSAQAHYRIGQILTKQGNRTGAVASFRRAAELNENLAAAHHHIGDLLLEQGDLRGATDSFRRALAIDSQRGNTHGALGKALRLQGDMGSGEASCRRAVKLDPSDFPAHHDLGLFAHARGDLAGAEASYRQALVLNPKYAEAHCNLGLVLLQQGDLRNALSEIQTGHELGLQDKEWRNLSLQRIKQCERYLQLDERLPAILKGDIQAAGASEFIELADLCRYKKFYHSSARFFSKAFASDGKLVSDFRNGLHSRAAASAALVGSGQGEEAARLADTERAMLRRQALEWLRAQLDWEGTLLNGSPDERLQTRLALYMWQNDPALQGVRDAAALAHLPAAEQAVWKQFWTEVATVLAKATDSK